MTIGDEKVVAEVCEDQSGSKYLCWSPGLTPLPPAGTRLYTAPPGAPVGVEVNGRAPTHYCRVCGALWADFGESWSLVSAACGKCCDNVPMGEQIAPLALLTATAAEIRAVKRARDFLARSDASEAEGDAFAGGWSECEAYVAQQPAADEEYAEQFRRGWQAGYAAGQQPAAVDGYTTGHCERHKQPGGCDLHNLHCCWPECDRRPAAQPGGSDNDQ